MKQYFPNSQFYLLLFYSIFATACNDQIAENQSTQSEVLTTQKIGSNESEYNTPREDSILQFSVMVTAIFEDSKGNFWFGSHGDGLCRYDGKVFTYFTVNHGLVSGIDREIAPGLDWSDTKNINGGNQIGSIQEDKNGDIWITSHDNISKFNGQVFTPVHAKSEGVLSTNKSDEEWEKELDYLWFGTSKLGVYRYGGGQLEFLKFPPPYSSDRDGVSEVYKDNDGNIWFGTMENGTFRYNGKSFTRINKEDEIGVCRSIFQDNLGRVWMTNNRFSLNYLEGDTLKSFIEEYKLISNNDPVSEEFKTGYQTIEQDENGDLWFGTFGSGLWRYDGKKLNHISEDNDISIALVKTIYKDNNKKLWFGIGEGTVYGYDGNSFYRFDSK